MKIKITSSQAEELKQRRSNLTTALGVVTRGNKKLEKLLNQQSSLTAEIQTLESADPDKKTVQVLNEARTELELVTRRVNDLPPTDHNAELQLKNALMVATSQVQALLKPIHDDYVSDIAKILRPFSKSDAWAKKLAGETNAAGSLAQLVWWDYARWGNPVTSANSLLARIDEILAGEVAWQFNPNAAL
ncbi:MAG TPA: hypothetical protein VGN23_13140 [Verrucomicrobiae bacterium]|jgi:hypothetical protein